MHSKCPNARSIFPSNEYVTAFCNTLVLKLQPYTTGSKFNCLAIEYGCADPEDTKKDIWAGMVRRLRSMTDEEVEILLCDHSWYLPEGEVCELEGHEHNKK